MFLPNYLNSLDAMHEAEKHLYPNQAHDYDRELTVILSDNGRSPISQDYLNYRATAAQRAEAFLRTLNLWTE